MRIIVIASGGVERRDGGGVFLGQVLEVLDGQQVCVVQFEVGGHSGPVMTPGAKPVLKVPVRGPVPGLGRLWTVRRDLANWIEWRLVRPSELRRAKHEMVSRMADFHADVVFCVMSSLETILLTPAVILSLNAPLATMEWDPISNMEHALDLPKFQFARICAAYDEVVRMAGGVAVASEGMAATYRRVLGRDAVVLRQYVDRDWKPPRSRRQAASDEWVIYHAGNNHGIREFDAFLQALDLCDWTIHGRPVRLRLLATHLNIEGRRPRRIEFLGWQPFERALDLAAEADLGYLSYWFDPSRSAEAENCFPAKMISYIAAGLPPFFHGPAASSAAQFLRRFDAGHVCTHQAPTEILEDLRVVLQDSARRERWRTACLRLAQTEFSRDTFRNRLLQLLEGAIRARGALAP